MKHLKYRLKCQSFSKRFNLGKLEYLSHPSCAKEHEIDTMQLLETEGVLKAENGLFSIEDSEGNGLILSSNILSMIETFKNHIISTISQQLGRCCDTVKENDVIFAYIDPIGPDKYFNIFCVCRNVKNIQYEILLQYTGNGLGLLLPDLHFKLADFLTFIMNFLPCINLYITDVAITHFTLSEDYEKCLRKVKNHQQSHIVTTNHCTKFINDHTLWKYNE